MVRRGEGRVRRKVDRRLERRTGDQGSGFEIAVGVGDGLEIDPEVPGFDRLNGSGGVREDVVEELSSVELFLVRRCPEIPREVREGGELYGVVKKPLSRERCVSADGSLSILVSDRRRTASLLAPAMLARLVLISSSWSRN
ncbi:MAG: hypothetical protein K0U98_04060 [Deltaproteobacteria bacterium]|nr:hypothetical protein [Deltaproteobacteria bacterium]